MLEQRSVLSDAKFEVREKGGRRTISGYAAVFDSDSHDLGGYIERIYPGAFDATLKDISDGKSTVACRVQHAGGLHTVGTTTNGTLSLSVDGKGLRYTAAVPDTSAGRDIVELVRGGYISKSSFAFSVRDSGEKWDFRSSVPVRTLTAVNLLDVSPVDGPAYEATSVEARSAAMASMIKAKPEAPLSGVDVRAQGDRRIAELRIMDEIMPAWMSRFLGGGVSAESIQHELDDAGDVDEIRVIINSPGGDVFEGLSIYNTLRDHKAPVSVEIQGLAASMGSVIAMAGDTIDMRPGSLMMIHRAWTAASGNANELRHSAMVLDKIDHELAGIYSLKSRRDASEFLSMMDSETWMSGKDAVNHGIATSAGVGEEVTLTEADGERCRKMGWRNIPESLGGSVEVRDTRVLSPAEVRDLCAKDIESAKRIA